MRETLVLRDLVDADLPIFFEQERDPVANYMAAFTAKDPNDRTAKDNLASLRVLQKCGFVITGEDQGFANARGAEIEEYVLTLYAPA